MSSDSIMRRSGFTMVEVITALLIIGVVSAVAIGFFSSTDYATEAGEAEQLRMDLRYAQQRAMGSLEEVLVRLNKNNDYYKFDDADRVFANGANRINLESDLKNSPNIIFSAQTGLPKVNKTYSYRIGESAEVTVDATTGLIQ